MLSDRLKSLRTRRKITQSDFAKVIGVARTTYAMYEQGQREPDYATLQKIADYYEVSLDFLVGRENEKSTSNNENEEFEALINDPEADQFYKEFKESPEERRKALLAAWEYLKSLEKK